MADYLAENQCPKCGKKLNTGFKCEVCDTMADKEEIILIARSTDYTLSNTDNDALFEGKIAPHCANVTTRQEAIEIMAKALCHRHCPEKVCTSCDEWEMYGTKEDAEAALNALLGVEK